ncbi:MAG: hypothetical protein ACP5T4_01840 [Candidatus Micrarchaeia archaeon]
MDIFQEYDIRGTYPKNLDEEKAERIGKAIAAYDSNQKVFLGHDNREGSLAINVYVKEGLVESGKQVEDVGLVPVMIPAFASYEEHTIGIEVTASHNPAQYTGVLIFENGVSVLPEKIRRIYEQAAFTKGVGKYEDMDYTSKYIEYIAGSMPNMKLNLGVDSMGGATTYVAKELFQRMGISPYMLHATWDSNFFGNIPEPRKATVEELGKLVKEKGLDYGVQLDGDGDRVAFVNEKGKFVEPMTVGMIFIKYLGFKNVLATIACSQKLEEFANVTYSPVGRPNLESKMATRNFDFGIETSMHMYFGAYYPFSDGLLATALMGKVLMENDAKLSMLEKEFPKIYYDEVSVEFDKDEMREAAFAHIEREAQKYGELITIDGIKLVFPDGFVLFRKSKTEPKLRAYFEGSTRKALEEMRKIAESLLQYSKGGAE